MNNKQIDNIIKNQTLLILLYSIVLLFEMNKPGVKKVVIKPFKTQPALPPNFQEITWNQLELSLHAVYNQTQINTSKEELFQVFI